MKLVHWQADVKQIRPIKLLQHLPPSQLQLVVSQLQAYKADIGEVLLSPFKPNQHLYLLLKGELKVYLDSPEERPCAILGPGDCAGEVSFIDHQPPCAYVVASQSSMILRLHRQALSCLSKQAPALAQSLLEALCRQIRMGNRQLVDSERCANLDSLTNCFNRRWLAHIFERESTRCQYNQQPLCMLMLDVDYFKDYNDQHGHLAGDYALCMVAHTVRNLLRPKDSLARYGGEEFIILLPEIDIHEARTIAERLRYKLEQIGSFYSPMGLLPSVTLSIGIATLQTRDSLEALINRCDLELYQAKQRGRNCLSG